MVQSLRQGGTPGHTSFRRYAKEIGYRKASAALGISLAHVSDLANAKKAPRQELQERIRDVVGIPLDAWEVRNAPVIQLHAGAPIAPGFAGPGPLPEAPDSALPEVSGRKAAYDHMISIRERYLAACVAGATQRDLSLLDASYTRAYSAYARMSGELELTEAQISRSPAWARMLESLFRALAEFPKAAEAVVRELDG